MKKEVTAAELGKMIRGLELKRMQLLEKEEKCSVFNCAASEEENIEALRPEYDFDETQRELHGIEDSIVTCKHLLNRFNATTVVGDTGLTVDQVLVRLPQLSREVEKLKRMSSRMERERIEARYGADFIDYTVANYDIDKVQKAYEQKAAKLTEYQLALDKTNMDNTITIEIEE